MTNIEKERLASEKLVEILNSEPEYSVLFDISPKVLRRLITEGINIAEDELNKSK